MPHKKCAKQNTKRQTKTKFKEFENILEIRHKSLLEILDSRNGNIKDLHSSALKDDSDLAVAHIQGQLDCLIIEKYALELQEVESSLQKIADGTYGICEMCDDEISTDRLRAKPHARYCIDCREVYEKSQRVAKNDKANDDKSAKSVAKSW